MAPSTAKQWKVVGKDGFDALKFEENASVATIGDKDVLVKGMYSAMSFSNLTRPR